jgi:hypothetical protein
MVRQEGLRRRGGAAAGAAPPLRPGTPRRGGRGPPEGCSHDGFLEEAHRELMRCQAVLANVGAQALRRARPAVGHTPGPQDGRALRVASPSEVGSRGSSALHSRVPFPLDVPLSSSFPPTPEPTTDSHRIEPVEKPTVQGSSRVKGLRSSPLWPKAAACRRVFHRFARHPPAFSYLEEAEQLKCPLAERLSRADGCPSKDFFF